MINKNIIAIVFVFFLLSCGKSENISTINNKTNQQNDPPYLRLPIEGEIGTIDPGYIQDMAPIEIVEQLFLGLTDFDPKTYEVTPELSTHWTVSPDGTVYRFYLRKDVFWTNGRAVTAHDVVWAIQRNISPEVECLYAYVMYIIKNAEAIHNGTINDISQLGVYAINDYAVEFHLENPAAYFPSVAGLWIFRPLPVEILKKYEKKWTDPENIVTNGSYLLDTWFEGSLMVLKKNPKYYDAANVNIDEVHYHIIPESYAGLVMYKNNDLDVLGGTYLRLPLTELNEIKIDPDLYDQYRNKPLFCTYFYGFNTKKTPVNNPLVRKAISAAVDRELLIEVITRGDEQPATTFTRPPLFGSCDPSEGVGVGFNPKQARQWLAEAGYPDGKNFPKISIVHNASETHSRVAKSIKSFLKYYLNIEVEVKSLEWNEYVNILDQPNTPHIFRTGWCADYPDANNWLNDVFHPKKSSNFIGWNNQEFANLMDQAQQNNDPKIRKKLYRRAEQILCDEEAAIIPIYFETAQYLVKNRLKGWYHMAIGGQHIRNWSLEK